MSEICKSSFLEESEPGIPDSTPPTLSQLSQTLNRRRGRKRARLTVGCGLAVIGLVVTAALQRGTQELPATTDSHRESVGTASQGESSSDVPIHEPSDIRVFASVYRSLPIFEIEADTQRFQHVGWIESEGIVPIDLTDATDDQQAMLRAVLSENTESKQIYL
jgi:hypothetical protein